MNGYTPWLRAAALGGFIGGVVALAFGRDWPATTQLLVWLGDGLTIAVIRLKID
jgi:hypothetical protein